MIAEAAYFLAERRGFNPGYEVEDWLTAEREVDHELTGQLGVPPAMSSKAQASFEHKLRARAQTLRSEIHETLLRTGNEQYVSIAGEVRDAEEDSVADLLVDVNLAEMTRDVEELRDTEAALLRMGTGTYGVCVTCGEPIALQRLEAYPTAKRCLACQRRYDQARQAAPPPSL